MNDRYEKTVLIPFRYRGGKLEMLNGDPLPAFKERAVGQIVVADYAVRDAGAIAELDRAERAFGLPLGASLLAAIAVDKGIPDELRDSVLKGDGKALRIAPEPGSVHILLLEDLQVQLRGSKAPRLSGVRCFIPALKMEATSVNHAYTLISESFEPNRLSHTGNVFQKVYFRDEDGQWRRLDVVRLRAEVAALRAAATPE